MDLNVDRLFNRSNYAQGNASAPTKKIAPTKKAAAKKSAKTPSSHEAPTYDSDDDTSESESDPDRPQNTPKTIRRNVLNLVKYSLQVPDSVASYMKGREDGNHEEEGQGLGRDVDKVLSSRVDRKRKAEKQKIERKGKAARR